MTLDEVIPYFAGQHASCEGEERAELYLQLATWLGELREYERMGPGARARQAAQTLIEEIGAPGPESVNETAQRAAAIIRGLRDKLHKADSTLEQLRDELAQAETILELHYGASEDDRSMERT